MKNLQETRYTLIEQSNSLLKWSGFTTLYVTVIEQSDIGVSDIYNIEPCVGT